jgi:hypothetical protein
MWARSIVSLLFGGDNGPLPSVWLHLEAAIFFCLFAVREFFLLFVR